MILGDKHMKMNIDGFVKQCAAKVDNVTHVAFEHPKSQSNSCMVFYIDFTKKRLNAIDVIDNKENTIETTYLRPEFPYTRNNKTIA
jgi:hypothetical protein